MLLTTKLQHRERLDLTLNIPDFESMTVEIKLTMKTFLYVPCTDLPIQMKRSSIKTTTGYLKSKYQLQRLIIGSDHNMDFLKHEKHRHTRDFMGKKS